MIKKAVFALILPLCQLIDKFYNCQAIPAIFYHSISDTGSRLSVSPAEFRKQISYLYEKDYQSILPEELKQRLEKKNKEKTIIISFDDGFKDNYEIARPIMNDFKMKATIFISSKYIGKKSYYCRDEKDREFPMMDKNEIKQIENQGWRIGSHFHSHRNLTYLKDREIIDELKKANLILKDIVFNERCLKIASYPRNKKDDRVVKIVKDMGVEMSFGGSGEMITQQSDFYRLPRFEIDKNTTMAKFKLYLSPTFNYFRKKTRGH